ncbi:predicted protein [Sclerotinia sclerotiorum 1980 UF-70]|uniref:Uncharacterized protein n=1 Tax=Sclerotinia sclerotiorum (strain ATCC 18683 / 1980 / Ss-1) TaxID=665079 RepID=A7EQM0_SCLS1|nr:predicted protein [Sclerotinia sclerotiorum 1980 UF-70]EDN91762.1 predicted protein [Sclerotinia sclerotiorum 1980 UF-70]
MDARQADRCISIRCAVLPANSIDDARFLEGLRGGEYLGSVNEVYLVYYAFLSTPTAKGIDIVLDDSELRSF